MHTELNMCQQQIRLEDTTSRVDQVLAKVQRFNVHWRLRYHLILLMSNSHLPPLSSDGVFSVSASSRINAPPEKVWAILLDFASYNEWQAIYMSPVSSYSHLSIL